jgi:hypothetical protein
MSDASDPSSPSPPDAPAPDGEGAGSRGLRKGPLSFLSGSLTSGMFAWLSLGLSGRVVTYYAAHPPTYSSRVAQSIGTAVKTLVVGMTFLATFTFAFVAIGLFLTFLRSLWLGAGSQPAPGNGRPS